MTFRIQLVTVDENGREQRQEVGGFQREAALRPETLGMSLSEAKAVLRRTQQIVVEQQVQAFLATQKACPRCGRIRSVKGHHPIVLRTLFGKMKLQSPRLRTCSCEPQTARSTSPLATALPERTTPELVFLETKWASLISYGASADLIRDVLPMDEQMSKVRVRRDLVKAATRVESALGEERCSYIEGCQRDWDELPIPDGPMTVGIDGGYVHARGGGNFEVIAGKSIRENVIR